MTAVKYLDVTESYADQIVKLQKAESAYFLQPLERFINNESKSECIHLLFSPDFGDKVYELYFDLVDAKYEINVADFDSDSKQSYMKRVFIGLIWAIEGIYGEKYGIKSESSMREIINTSGQDKFWPAPLQARYYYKSGAVNDKYLGLICKQHTS